MRQTSQVYRGAPRRRIAGALTVGTHFTRAVGATAAGSVVPNEVILWTTCAAPAAPADLTGNRGPGHRGRVTLAWPPVAGATSHRLSSWASPGAANLFDVTWARRPRWRWALVAEAPAVQSEPPFFPDRHGRRTCGRVVPCSGRLGQWTAPMTIRTCRKNSGCRSVLAFRGDLPARNQWLGIWDELRNWLVTAA